MNVARELAQKVEFAADTDKEADADECQPTDDEYFAKIMSH